MKSRYHQYDYYKGLVDLSLRGFPDTYRFDLFNGGAFLIITLNSPTQDEIDQISSGGEFSLSCMPSAMWLTYKFGDLPIADGPYTPHLSTQATNLVSTLVQSCSNITIMVVDTLNGEYKYVGNVECSPVFSAALRAGTMSLLMQDFDEDGFNEACDAIMEKFSGEDIKNMSVASMKYTFEDVLTSSMNPLTREIVFR